jgi:hypothetical protein
MGHLNLETVSISRHLKNMKSCGGSAFIWPKPMLHPPLSLANHDLWLHVQPCAMCKKGFYCLDFVVTSCKHMYHLYCLVEVFKSTDKCVLCESITHLDWSMNWGFGPQSQEMQLLALDLKVLENWASLKVSLQSSIMLKTSSAGKLFLLKNLFSSKVQFHKEVLLSHGCYFLSKEANLLECASCFLLIY